MYDINYHDSIKKKRIKYNDGILEKFSNIFVSFSICFWMISVGSILIYDSLDGFGNSPSNLQILIELLGGLIFLGFGIIIIRRYLNINKLTGIKGISAETNRNIIQQIVNDRNWDVHLDNKKFLKANYNSPFSWGCQIYILYSKEMVYINITSFGFHDMKSAFHFIADKRRLNQIEVDFEEKVCQILENSNEAF